MGVYRSRHTPGVKASEILISIGEVVQFQTLSGKTIDVRITSGKLGHVRCPTFGYEGIASDTGELGFFDVERIVGWSSNP